MTILYQQNGNLLNTQYISANLLQYFFNQQTLEQPPKIYKNKANTNKYIGIINKITQTQHSTAMQNFPSSANNLNTNHHSQLKNNIQIHQHQHIPNNNQLQTTPTCPTLSQIFNPDQLQILHNIHNMLTATSSQQSENQLKKMYETYNQAYIQSLFNILNKSMNNTISLTDQKIVIQSVLLYLRHFINSQQSRLPDLNKKFIDLHKKMLYSKYNELVVECFRTYLGKNIHKIYIKQYLHEVSYQLLQQIQAKTISEEYLTMIVSVLQNLVQSSQYRPGLVNQAQNMLKQIVSTYCTVKPVEISTQLWVWAILVLASYSRACPCIDFIQKYTVIDGFSMYIYTKLFNLIYRQCSKFLNVEKIYYIVQVQIRRISDRKFIRQLYQFGNIEAVESIVRNIVFLLKNALSLISQSSSTDINELILFQYFRQYQFFQKCLTNILSILEQFHYEQTQFSYLVTQLLEQYTEFLTEQLLHTYIQKLKSKIKIQYIFCLLSGMSRNTMEMFGATNLIIQYVNNIEKFGIDLADRWVVNVLEMFLGFVIKYLDVYHYLGCLKVKIAVFKLINNYIANLPNSIDKYITNNNSNNRKIIEQRTLKIMSYGISLQCHFQKHTIQTSDSSDTYTVAKQRVSQLLQMVYKIIYGLCTDVETDQQADIIAIALDGISELKHIYQYGDIMCECLIGFFKGKLGEEIQMENKMGKDNMYINGSSNGNGNTAKLKRNNQYIYLNFLKILQDCHSSQFHPKRQQTSQQIFTIKIRHQLQHQFDQPLSKSPPQSQKYKLTKSQYLLQLFTILKHLMHNHRHNKSLLDQICEYVLQILYALNCNYAKQQLSQSEIDWIYEHIYNIGIYEYIEKSFMQEDQDYLYCKILIETLLHKVGAKIVQNLLTKVSFHDGMFDMNHNYDIVWEALVILYEVRNQYTEKKEINMKIDNILGGNVEMLLMNLSIDQKNQYQRFTKKQANQGHGRKKINWCWLPQVRKVLEPGSYVGVCVEHKLNQSILG